MPDNNDMQAVIDAARQSVEAVQLDNEVVFLPTAGDGQGTVVDLEKYKPTPRRKRGTVIVFDAASFNQVIADNSDAGNIAIYLDRNPDKPSVVAVLNGNGKAGAGWSDFRCEIAFRSTPQWLKWKSIDGKMLPQVTFAEFVEDNLADIAEPAGAAMLEIATYLEAVRSVNFKSGVRLSSGAIQFQHAEDIEAKVGSGQIAIPETFTLALAPVFGLPAYRIPARFRYRIQDGKLTLGLKLQRVEDMMAQIIEDVIAKIERGANVSVMDGLPPA